MGSSGYYFGISPRPPKAQPELTVKPKRD